MSLLQSRTCVNVEQVWSRGLPGGRSPEYRPEEWRLWLWHRLEPRVGDPSTTQHEHHKSWPPHPAAASMTLSAPDLRLTPTPPFTHWTGWSEGATARLEEWNLMSKRLQCCVSDRNVGVRRRKEEGGLRREGCLQAIGGGAAQPTCCACFNSYASLGFFNF